jgi:hypothetical protein
MRALVMRRFLQSDGATLVFCRFLRTRDWPNCS